MDWINVTDRLPKKSGKYICYSEEGYVSIEDYEMGEQEIYCDNTDSGYATHWQPLPEPPNDTSPTT